MKIAILYSGLYRVYSNWQQNHQDNLPAGDVYYSTWESERKKVEIDDMIYFKDPKKTYNCYAVQEFGDKYGHHLKTKTGEKSRHYTGYFQHLAHWNVLQSLNKQYDVIIRMRYDTVLGPHKDSLYQLCELCYQSGNPIGIGNSNSKDDYNKTIHEMPHTVFNSSNDYLLDFMTIHKQNNVENVEHLVKEEKMWPTNAGWWQMLGKNGYLNYRGGIQLQRYT